MHRIIFLFFWVKFFLRERFLIKQIMICLIKILSKKYKQESHVKFFTNIEKIKNNFQDRTACFQKNLTPRWEYFLTCRGVVSTNDDDSYLGLKEISPLDAKAVALYNLYFNIAKKRDGHPFNAEFAAESLSFFNFIDAQQDSFFEQNNYSNNILTKEEINFSAGLLAGLLKESGIYKQYQENKKNYETHKSYNYWKEVGTFCDRYSPLEPLSLDREPESKKNKKNKNFFYRNYKWYIAGGLVVFFLLYLSLKNKK